MRKITLLVSVWNFWIVALYHATLFQWEVNATLYCHWVRWGRSGRGAKLGGVHASDDTGGRRTPSPERCEPRAPRRCKVWNSLYAYDAFSFDWCTAFSFNWYDPHLKYGRGKKKHWLIASYMWWFAWNDTANLIYSDMELPVSILGGWVVNAVDCRQLVSISVE